MPSLPLHPAIVHVPIGLAVILPLIAIGIALAVRAGRLPRAAFAVVLVLQALLVGSGIAAYLAGEKDEHVAERVIAEKLIEGHEERAEAFLWAAGVVLAGAGALLVVPAGAVGLVSAAVVAGTVAVTGLGLWTGRAGGELVYVHGAAQAWRAPAAQEGDPRVLPARHGRHGDDD
jgi:uncharacterized membrane protein